MENVLLKHDIFFSKAVSPASHNVPVYSVSEQLQWKDPMVLPQTPPFKQGDTKHSSRSRQDNQKNPVIMCGIQYIDGSIYFLAE